MATTEEPPITGYGRMKRKEDPRFVRGQGRYIDDLKLPGMLHGAVLRSPLAHAKILSIDTSAALAHPKVRAVVTGADLAGLNLAWMPTMSADTQAVLATDKVRFQGQEVAFVVAEDRYAARDALELIEVDYEELPAVVNARKALDADAPVIRDDQEGAHGQPHLRLGGRRQGRHRRRLRRGRSGCHARHDLPALPSGSAGDVRRGGPHGSRDGPADALHDDAGAACAPDRLRARRRPARAQDPDHPRRHRRRLRQQGPGLSGLRLRDRRLDPDRQAGEVAGGPLGEPDVDRLRARLRDARGDRCDRRTARSPAYGWT